MGVWSGMGAPGLGAGLVTLAPPADYTENVNFTLESPHGGITKEGDDVVLRCHGDGYPSQAYTFNTVEVMGRGQSTGGGTRGW